MEDTTETVVVIEDDEHIADLVNVYLRKDGFRVLRARDGEKGLALISREAPVFVILDIGLPGSRNGFDVCREIRARHRVPLLFLTARNDEVDRILGLELGADDYLTKPFSPGELMARVRAVLRRTRESSTPVQAVTLGNLELDIRRREVRRDGTVVPLANREFDLLAFLFHNVGLVLTRQQLLDAVWGAGWFGGERTVDVHIGHLRRKLGDGLPLATVWGFGYRLG